MKPHHPVKGSIIALVVAAVILVLHAKYSHTAPPLESSDVAAHAESADPEDLTSSSPDSPAAEQISLPKLVDLGSTTCIPCKKMAPILDILREEFAGQFDVLFIDTRQDQQAAAPYRIRVIPTQVFFDEKGNELFRHEGFYSRQDILGAWAEFGYAFSLADEDADAG
ncbi:MAG: thioredoxin family protein [Phycisphaerales bacterium]|nr:thioredoxin family protein [Phycisphaerales bacterium]